MEKVTDGQDLNGVQRARGFAKPEMRLAAIRLTALHSEACDRFSDPLEMGCDSERTMSLPRLDQFAQAEVGFFTGSSLALLLF